jgi:nitrogen regulatory protein PII
MKRIEAVILPRHLDTFKEAAPRLGIREFTLIDVYRSGCTTIDKQTRLYRGREFTADFLPCLKLEFALFDDAVQSTLHQLLELVNPESIAVFKLDQTLRLATDHLKSQPARDRETNHSTGPRYAPSSPSSHGRATKTSITV